MLRVLGLALVGVVVTETGWRAVDRVILGSGEVSALARLGEPPDIVRPRAEVELNSRDRFAVQLETHAGPMWRGWHWASQPFLRMFQTSEWPEWFALLLNGMWTVAVWALFGGAMARIAALYLTQGEAIGPIAALQTAAFRWPSTAGAPLLALLAMLLVAAPLVLSGWLARLDIFALLAAVLWFLALAFGIVVALLAIGLAIGWPLMASAVAVERTDAFDAISRGYAYVFQRPLHALFYLVVSGLLGVATHAAVNFIVDASLGATHRAFFVGAGDERREELERRAPDDDGSVFTSPEETAARMIRFWDRTLAMVALAFPMAYLWPASVGIYLLLRRQIDSTDIGESKFDEGEPRQGAPMLATDPATGVPHVGGGNATGDPMAAPSPPAP
jgi:hypothetical protein